MQTEIIISGFGGQGALFAGQLLAYTALEKGLHVTWFPSYGPEMRGGTAHCIVIVADDEIGSPVVLRPEVAVAMNLPSLDKYEPLVKEGGLLLVNSSLVDRTPQRKDIDSLMIQANEIAEELGDKRMANLVLVGAPQLGQTRSSARRAKPHSAHVVGWEAPRGAPQAMQWGSPTGLGVMQYSHTSRRRRSERAWEAPRASAVRSTVCQTLSFNCSALRSAARSSSRPSRKSGLRRA